jgi:uncharacterized protein YcbK (DUF882 family)
MIWSRRRLLTMGGALAGMSAAGCGWASTRLYGTCRAGAAGSGEAAGCKGIALLNLHTDERLQIEYFRDGAYLPAALSAIEGVLRDFRTGERHAIDPRLMDYLVTVAETLGVEPEFSVISGYRSPETNARLRERSAGVARRSLHMEGRAIDVRMRGVDCASLAARATDLQHGGVGYYRASDFVHLDTGAFRTWRG